MITVIVFTIIGTMIVPNVVSFFKHFEGKSEAERIYLIKQAILAYEEEQRHLPPEATWSDDILKYTDLTKIQVEIDTWGNPTQYRMFRMVDIPYSGGFLVDSDYAIVMSYGSNGEIDPDTELTDGGVFGIDPIMPDDPLESWPPLQDDALAVYINLAAGGDDRMAVITNATKQASRVETTRRRMAAILEAVANFEEMGKAQDLWWNGTELIDANNPEHPQYGKLYRPIGTYFWWPIWPVQKRDPLTNYSPWLQNQTIGYFGGGSINLSRSGTAFGTDSWRKLRMIDLVQMIGLPKEYCCSAVDLYPVGAGWEERPFFYYSNPLRMTPGGCDNARPRYGLPNNKYLPPRLAREQREFPFSNPQWNNCG